MLGKHQRILMSYQRVVEIDQDPKALLTKMIGDPIGQRGKDLGRRGQ